MNRENRFNKNRIGSSVFKVRVFEVYIDESNEWRWRLVKREILASSGEGYGTAQECYDDMLQVMMSGKGTPIIPVEEDRDVFEHEFQNLL